jgi:hypothetical protein
MIIFSTGNAVFMGARSDEDIVFMIDELVDFIMRVQKHLSAVVPREDVAQQQQLTVTQRAHNVLGYVARIPTRRQNLIPLGKP